MEQLVVLALGLVLMSHDVQFVTNLSKYIRDIIEDWGIASKLGFMQMDNASNNDTLIEELEARKSY